MLEPSHPSLFRKKLRFSVFVLEFFLYPFRDYFFSVILFFDSMRNVFETLKGLFFAFRENLPHQLLTYTWEKRYGVQTCCYRLRVVEEIHEPRLLLLDYHFCLLYTSDAADEE